MATIREIAKLAGVSPSTVSRILNRDPLLSVKKATREEVERIAAKLNYRSVHQSKESKLKRVAIVTSMSEKREIEDPYWRNIHRSIKQSARKYGLEVARIIRLSDKKTNSRQLSLDQYSSIILTGDLSEKAIKEIKKINPKMVLVDARLRFDTIDSVEPDLMTITEKILDQFLLIGRKKIAFIGALNKRLNLNDQPEENWEDSRSVAYRRWTKQHDLPAMIINGDWSAESGYQSIKKLFQDFGKVDALIAASDVISIGAIKYLQEQKITIGKDILLASFDDLSFISYLNPSLTSVDLSPDAIGSTALKQALELADNERDWHKWTIIPGKIVYRDSFNFKNLK